MPLINHTYFIGNLSISQIAQPAVEELVTTLINRYEPQFLTELLGYGFQKVLLANLAEARFLALLNGAEFTDANGKLHYFYGLANSTTKVSPIANYIFYQYVKGKYEQQSGIATVVPKAENSKVVAPEYTLINAYNEMVDYIRVLRQFLKANAAVYPEYVEKDITYFIKLNHYF